MEFCSRKTTTTTTTTTKQVKLCSFFVVVVVLLAAGHQVFVRYWGSLEVRDLPTDTKLHTHCLHRATLHGIPFMVQSWIFNINIMYTYIHTYCLGVGWMVTMLLLTIVFLLSLP